MKDIQYKPDYKKNSIKLYIVMIVFFCIFSLFLYLINRNIVSIFLCFAFFLCIYIYYRLYFYRNYTEFIVRDCHITFYTFNEKKETVRQIANLLEVHEVGRVNWVFKFEGEENVIFYPASEGLNEENNFLKIIKSLGQLKRECTKKSEVKVIIRYQFGQFKEV